MTMKGHACVQWTDVLAQPISIDMSVLTCLFVCPARGWLPPIHLAQSPKACSCAWLFWAWAPGHTSRHAEATFVLPV